MTNGPKILVVEDEQEIRRFLRASLDHRGYRLIEAETGHSGLLHATSQQPDLILLDLGLPDIDGLEVIRQVRAWSKIPIIVLSARGREAEKVSALDAGADDYLTKPFSFKILLARLRALARRKTVQPTPQLEVADLMLDPATYEVKRAGSLITITRTEFSLLEVLMRNAGRVMTRSRLIESVWGFEREVGNNTIDVYIRMLRSKVEPPRSQKLIYTIRGVGYVMREEDSA